MYYTFPKSKKLALLRPSSPRIPRIEDNPFYTGTVQGRKASKAEENLAKILDDNKVNYLFRFEIPIWAAQAMGSAGTIEVDFIITDGQLRPIGVEDMEFIHANYKQRQRDAENDGKIDRFLRSYGAAPIIHISAMELDILEVASLAVRKYGII